MENQEVSTQKIAEARTAINLTSPSHECKPRICMYYFTVKPTHLREKLSKNEGIPGGTSMQR